MKPLALVATVVNAILLAFVFQHLHTMELRNERKERAEEVNAIQVELEHFRAMAAMLAQRLSEQQQGEQLEKLGAQ